MFNYKQISLDDMQKKNPQDSNIIHWNRNTNKDILKPLVITYYLHIYIITFRFEWITINCKKFSPFTSYKWICVTSMVWSTDDKPQRSLNLAMALTKSFPLSHLSWILNTTFQHKMHNIFPNSKKFKVMYKILRCVKVNAH